MRRNGKGNRRKKPFNRRGLALRVILLFLLFWGAVNGTRIVSRLSLGTGSLFGDSVVGNGPGGLFGGRAGNPFSEEIYPDSLVKLARDNPETEQFVKDYPEKKDSRGKIDVSGDLTGGIPLFLQWDERWGYRQYGGDFMALNGCGPTCLSMVRCGLSDDGKWNPYKVAKMAEKKGYYVKGKGSSWELMTAGAAEMGLSAEAVSFDREHILESLRQGKPIICVVGAGDFTTQGHFLVLAGVKQDGRIQVHDPNSRKRSRRGWELERLMPQIRNLWAYSM